MKHPGLVRMARGISKARRASSSSWARRKARWLAAGYLWVNVGGGTWIQPPRGRKRFPSDSEWVNLKTGQTVIVTCTSETYLGALRNLHGRIRSLREITRLPGIGKIER
jgi:hypothetical protein